MVAVEKVRKLGVVSFFLCLVAAMEASERGHSLFCEVEGKK